MDIDQLLNDPGYHRFCSIYRGLAFAGHLMEPYTREGLRRIHQKIYRNLSHYPECTNLCSKTYGQEIVRWCRTCTHWRKGFLSWMKGTRNLALNWGRMKSWEWPKSYENIAEIFLNRTTTINFTDISQQCTIWITCPEFAVQTHVTDRLREYRNSYFAHNPTLRATDVEKSKVFDVIRDLIKDPDAKQYIRDIKTCLKEVTSIENMEGQSSTVDSIYETVNENRQSIAQLSSDVTLVMHTLECTNEDQRNWIKHLHDLFLKSCDKSPYKKGNCVYTFVCVLFSCVSMCLAIYWILYVSSPGQDYKVDPFSGCVEETFSFHFKEDLPLLGYLREHKHLTGRQWLTEDIEKLVFEQNTSSNGVILVAEPGYGKSAFMKHLLCCKKEDVGYRVRDHVVAFHVCKYNDEQTQNVGLFVRRIIAMLAYRIGEYGYIISRLPNKSIIFDSQACQNKIIACFDEGLSIPLSQLSNDHKFPWVILLDGLDECFDTHIKQNLILDLLVKRIKKLPNVIKFIITSKNFSTLRSLSEFTIIDLKSNDSRNIGDIQEYLKSKNGTYTASDEFLNYFSNFLHVKHMLELIKDNNYNLSNAFTVTLFDIIEDKFERYFMNDEDYCNAKIILEIVCATFRPLNFSEIFSIAQSSNSSVGSDFHHAFEKLDFILRIENTVTLQHQAFYNWLLNSTNAKYKISIENGHRLISKHIFAMLDHDLNYSEDIVDLTIHVSKSVDQNLNSEFEKFNFSSTTNMKMDLSLHRLIWKSSSVKALQLLLYHVADLEKRNEGGVTAAFVAVARGNLKQFALLHKKGSNIEFTSSKKIVIECCNILDQIYFMKQNLFLGYGLVHIAAHHGLADMVDYLLKINRSTLTSTTSLGLRPSDIACENGHINVLVVLMKWSISVLDKKCLYYASKGNHVEIVKLLTKNDVRLECISDKEVADSLKQIDISFDMSISLILNEFRGSNCFCHEEIYPYDVWWIIMRENPLFAALKSDSFDVAKLLIKTFPDKMDCIDSFGFTASLSSVFYGRFEILSLLLGKLKEDTCNPSLLKKEILIKSLDVESYALGCPTGASFAHLVAFHRQRKLIKLLVDNQYLVKWDATDKDGNYPEHYAASNDNVYYLKFSLKQFGNDIFKLTSKNGSTIFHLTALTWSYLSFRYLTNRYSSSVPDVKDKHNLGILHYIVFRDFNNVKKNKDTLQNSIFRMFKEVVESHCHNLTHIDIFKRNILHYALRFGHYEIVNYLRIIHSLSFHQLLSGRDIDSMQPVSYAIHHIQRKEQNDDQSFFVSFSIAKDGSREVHFICYRDHTCKSIMTPCELSLLYVFQTLNFIEFSLYIETHLSEIMRKSIHLTKAVLIYHTSLSNEKLAQAIEKSLTSSPFPRKETLEIIAYKRPMAFTVCRKEISPLNIFARKQVGAGVLTKVVNILMTMLNFNSSFISCKDSNGLNIFHNALLSGNIFDAEKLLFYDIINRNYFVDISDVIFMAFSKPLQPSVPYLYHFEDKPENIEKIDKLISLIIEEKNEFITSTEICCDQCSSLSGIHVAVAYNLSISIQTMVSIYGDSILNCKNADGFTPIYFAKLFKNENFISLYSKSVLKLQLPDRYAEQNLLYSIHVFPKGIKSFTWKCVMPYTSVAHRFQYTRHMQEVLCYENLFLARELQKECSGIYIKYPFILHKIIQITQLLRSSTEYLCIYNNSKLIPYFINKLIALFNIHRLYFKNILKGSHLEQLQLITRFIERFEHYFGVTDCIKNTETVSDFKQLIASSENIILLAFKDLRSRIWTCQSTQRFVFSKELAFLQDRLSSIKHQLGEKIKSTGFNQHIAILKNSMAIKSIQNEIEQSRFWGIKKFGEVSVHTIEYKAIRNPFHDLEEL